MDIQKTLKFSLIALIFVNTSAFSLERQVNPSPNTKPNAGILLASTDTSVIPSAEEDTIITKSIKSHMANSQLFSRLNIDVTTEQGIVTLKGNVSSNSQASKLIELAQSVVGVRDVRPELTVAQSGQVVTDTIITAKIKGLFIREGVFGPKRPLVFLNVETRNGVVYLKGNITDKRKVDRAIELIRGVNGVKSVEYKFMKLTPNN